MVNTTMCKFRRFSEAIEEALEFIGQVDQEIQI